MCVVWYCFPKELHGSGFPKSSLIISFAAAYEPEEVELDPDSEIICMSCLVSLTILEVTHSVSSFGEVKLFNSKVYTHTLYI